MSASYALAQIHLFNQLVSCLPDFKGVGLKSWASIPLLGVMGTAAQQRHMVFVAQLTLCRARESSCSVTVVHTTRMCVCTRHVCVCACVSVLPCGPEVVVASVRRCSVSDQL